MPLILPWLTIALVAGALRRGVLCVLTAAGCVAIAEEHALVRNSRRAYAFLIKRLAVEVPVCGSAW